jgi:hypothetical protein
MKRCWVARTLRERQPSTHGDDDHHLWTSVRESARRLYGANAPDRGVARLKLTQGGSPAVEVTSWMDSVDAVPQDRR